MICMCDKEKWEQLLKVWELKVLDILKDAQNEGVNLEGADILLDILKYNSMMFPGASEREVIRAEERLSCKLPDSYRQFIQLTNGWRHVFLDQEDGLILPIDQIALFKYKYPAHFKYFEDYEGMDVSAGFDVYYMYEESRKADVSCVGDVSSSIAISEYVNNGVVLLVPAVTFKDSEWEVWHIQMPDGIYRYDSFWSWMKAESVRTVNVLEDDIKYWDKK